MLSFSNYVLPEQRMAPHYIYGLHPSAVTDIFNLSAEEGKILDKCVTKYPRKLNVVQVIFLIENAIKSIFGCSNWQKAQQTLNNRIKSSLKIEDTSILNNNTKSMSEFLLEYFVSINLIYTDNFVSPWRAKLAGAIPFTSWSTGNLGQLKLETVIEAHGLKP